MATNLDLQAQLNQLLADQNKLLEESAKLAKDQASLTRDMVNTLRSANFKDVATDIQNATQAVSGASEATKGLGATNQDVFDQMNAALREAAKREEESGKGIEDMTKKVKRFSVAAAAIDGFVQGLRFTANMLHTVKDVGIGLVETLGNLAASIIAIPFKMLTGLINMADAGGGDTGLRQALEDIRKEFGALHATSGQAIISMARNLKGELAQTGLSVYRIFGNLAERLKFMQEYAHNLGPLFANLAGQFVRNTEAIGAYYKGLGLTEEGQKAVATRAHALQTALTDELREIANYSLQLSKAFNGAAGSAKEISRDMATLMADFKHFGGISTKEIGQAVVYFRRLGIEISKVMGVIERYDNFEDAAQGAAHLSQAFNMNVDALEMMKAQNPAERVEMLRKSFFAAGRSIEHMTRQERALLAQQTGLEDSALDLAFSMKNQGMTYDQVTRKADAAKKTQMTQVQAMKALADSIERLVKSGSSGSGGFIDRFIQGFNVGIQRSQEFRHLMRELRLDLRVAYWEGIKVGKAFVEMFPGVKDVFKGIADLFERRKFRTLFTGAREAFREFFKDMTTDPQTALPKLLENLKKNFFSWFQGNSQNGQRTLEGFRKFFTALSEITGSMLRIAMKGLREGIEYITDLIAGRKSLDLSGAQGGLGFLGPILRPIIDAIKEVGPSLWGAVKEMFSEVWKKAEPWLKSHLLEIVGVLAGPAFVGLLGRAVSTALAGMVTQGLIEYARSGGMRKAVDAVKERFVGQATTATQALARVPGAPGGQGAGQAAAGAIRGAEQAAEAASSSKVNWGQALVKMAAITLFIVAGMVGVLYAIFRFAKAIQQNHLTPQSITSASIAMVAAATSMVAIGGAVKLLSTIDLNPGMALRIVGGLVVVGAVSAAMAYGAKEVVGMFKNVPVADIAKTVAVMTATGTFFLATAAVVAIAGGIGLAATAGGGFGAAVIAAGLGAIVIATQIMADQGLKIMEAIKNFQPGSGFAEKAAAFTSIMTSIGAFAASIAQIVAATRPSFLSIFHSEREQRTTLIRVGQLITNLGNQLTNIVGRVQAAIGSLQGNEQTLKAAQMLGAALGGVAELANALKPPTEAMQESGWYTTLTGGGEDIAAKVGAVSDFIQAVSVQLRFFLNTISNLFKGQGAFANGMTEQQQRAAQAIPNILSGVATFANSLRAGSSAVLQLASGGNQVSVLNAVGNYMTSLLKGLTQSGLFEKIGRIIRVIVFSIGSLNAAQAKAVEALAPIIGPIFSSISQIVSVVSNLSKGNLAPQATNVESIAQLTDFVSTFFTRIQTTFPGMIRSMNEIFSSMSVSTVRKIEVGTKSLNSLMTSITQMVANQPLKAADIQTRFTSLGSSLYAFQHGMGLINTQLEGSSSLENTVDSFLRNIHKTHITRVSNAVTQFVSKANELAVEINNLRPINIETGLKNLGNNLGLGASGQYEIKNRNFTVQVNLTVKIDNNGLDALELAMIRRNGPQQTRLSVNDSAV